MLDAAGTLCSIEVEVIRLIDVRILSILVVLPVVAAAVRPAPFTCGLLAGTMKSPRSQIFSINRLYLRVCEPSYQGV